MLFFVVMRTAKLLSPLFCLLLPAFVLAQSKPEPVSSANETNRIILSRLCDVLHSDPSARTLSEKTLVVARELMDTPYVAGTLEGETEEFKTYLDKTDCMLFVESCIAVALTSDATLVVPGEGLQFVPYAGTELFLRNIMFLRYRNPAIPVVAPPDVRYDTRLHYASDWMLQAEGNGVLRELSKELGEPRAQKFNYMSTHPASYPQLKDNVENQRLIREVEQKLEAKGPYFYIPQNRIEALVKSGDIRDGDIIAFVSNTTGLDVTHLGIACSVNGEMHFIHASSAAGKVIMEPKTLSAYAKNGIRIFRLS